MFVRVKTRSNGKKSIQIVESVRRGDNISQKIMRHVGQAESDREVEELKKLAESIIVEMKDKRQPVLPLFAPEEIYSRREKKPIDENVNVKNLREEQRIIDGIGEVFGELYDQLSLDKIIKGTKKDEQWNEILRACVLARLANPVSKRRTASLLEEDYGIKISLEKIYRMMDHLANQEENVKQCIAQSTLSLFAQKVDLLLFDVTTLYFESVEVNETKNFGFSKDCKFKEVQVVLAMITTTSGLPITYKLFPGNIYEGNTLIEMVHEIKNLYQVENALLVADRAMFSEKNLQFMEENNIEYIVAAKLKSLKREEKENIINSEKFIPMVIEDQFHWVNEYSKDNRRLIVSYSSDRARKDQNDRNRLVERLLKKTKEGKLKVKDLITNHGTKKYINVENNTAKVNEAKISEDARWDGLHGVISNSKSKTAKQILEKYKSLWMIEEAFRMNKHDLKMRPIFHWNEERINAHISLCFIAFALAKQATYRISLQQKEMSFEQIRNELLHVQSSILVDTKSKKKYLLPSKMTVNAKKIYHVFGIQRSLVPSRFY